MRKKKTGRKPLLLVQPKLVQLLCSYLWKGCSMKTACQASYISQTCFHDYIRRADPHQPDHAPEFAQFAERIARARGAGKASLVSMGDRFCDGDHIWIPHWSGCRRGRRGR